MSKDFYNIASSVEGRNFIYKATDFFVCRAREKVKDNIFKPLEEEPAKKYYESYKFIYDKASVANIKLCYLLVEAASRYIDFIEDGINPNFQFPFDCDCLFNLHSWFKEIDIKHCRTYKILILLIVKLYDSPYYTLII